MDAFAESQMGRDDVNNTPQVSRRKQRNSREAYGHPTGIQIETPSGGQEASQGLLRADVGEQEAGA